MPSNKHFIGYLDDDESNKNQIVIYVEGKSDKELFDAFFSIYSDRAFEFCVPKNLETPQAQQQSEKAGLDPRPVAGNFEDSGGCRQVIDKVRRSNQLGSKRKQVFGFLDKDVLIKQKHHLSGFAGLNAFSLREADGVLSHALDENLLLIGRYEIENYVLDLDTIYHYLVQQQREFGVEECDRCGFRRLVRHVLYVSILIESAEIHSHKRCKIPSGFYLEKWKSFASWDDLVASQQRSEIRRLIMERFGSAADIDESTIQKWQKFIRDSLSPSSHENLDTIDGVDELLIERACGKTALDRLGGHFACLNTKRPAVLLAQHYRLVKGEKVPPFLVSLVNECLQRAGKPALAVPA